MTPSPALSRWPLAIVEDDGYETPDSTPEIHVEAPEETDPVAMQVSVDGVTVDGCHAEHYPSQDGQLNHLFDDNAQLVNFDCHSLGIWNSGSSPASSPPCSPSPSSGSNTPESGYLSGEYLSSPEIISDEQEGPFNLLAIEDRLFQREQFIPSLLLQETDLDTFASSRVFSEEELRSLNSGGIVDQNSPSPHALSPHISPLTPPSGSISEPIPSSSNRRERRHIRRRSERVLLLENPPLTRKDRRSARRASSSPYPSPHSSPSSREPTLPQAHYSPNSTSQSMGDNRALDQAVYRHPSTSASSLPSPRGSHASPHAASYSPEHRPQSPSLVHRTLAREGRRKSRSISPFDNGSGLHHGHRPRSSSRTRPDVFTQIVPPYLTKNKNIGGSGAGASTSPPAGSSSSAPQKSYPLRTVTSFEIGRQQQPVVQGGGVQRPSSLVRANYVPEDDMTSSSNEDAEMDDEADQHSHERGRGRRASVSSLSSSSSVSLPPPPPPPKQSSAARRISAGVQKGRTAQGFGEGADGMTIDARACEPEAPDTDDPGSDEEIDAEEDYRRSKRTQGDLGSQRRSSYPSVQHYPSSHYASPTAYPSTFIPSPHVPSSLREEVPRSRIQSRTRSHSHSPSRHDRSRSLSRARYSPIATRAPNPSHPHEPRSSSRPRPSGEEHPVRRSTRLSKSPARQSDSIVIDTDRHLPERVANQQYPHCGCGFTAQNRAELLGHLRKNAGTDCRELHEGDTTRQTRVPKSSPTRIANTRRRNSDASRGSYHAQHRRDFEAEEDSGVSELEGEEDDDDEYFETGSQRGRRTKKRASPSRATYSYHGGTQPLQGSPLKRSAVLLSPSSPVSETKISQLQPSHKSYQGHSRSASDSSIPGRPSGYYSNTTRRSPANRSPHTNSTPLQVIAYTADRSPGANNGTAAPVGGTIVSGVGAMSVNPNQYRSVGSKNIDNASEKRRKGEKRFRCKFEDCGKMFTTNQNCQIHERKHVGDAPYRCGCGYAVAGRSDLVRHLRKKNVNPECRELPREDARRVGAV